MQVKMRNLRNGSMNVERFSSEDRVERVVMDEHEMEYLYKDGDFYYFMNTVNYEQIHMTRETLGDAVDYLLPNMKINVEFHEEKAVGIELPATVDLLVVETEPGIKGATASNVNKPAKLETGIEIRVPFFIKQDEKIKVSTETREFAGRA